jgi:hypothetical protein
MIDLLQMTMQFQSVNDRETERACFRTNLPWIGPLAYFNIIYKPAPNEILEYGKETLELPEPITQFLNRQNGAILFLALSTYMELSRRTNC